MFPSSTHVRYKFFFQALILVFLVASGVYLLDIIKYQFKKGEKIVVTGLGSQDFISDLIIWQGSFSQTNTNIKVAYENLNRDREQIKAYLIKQGVLENDIVFEAVNTYQDYDNVYDRNGSRINRHFKGYVLTQYVTIQSKNVHKIEMLSKKITELMHKGIAFNSQSPRYYYTQLASLKLEMIASATQDAKNRALQIAENAGAELGHLVNASMGVFQIIGKNSSENYSYGGTFNTRDKVKTATITIRLEYHIQ